MRTLYLTGMSSEGEESFHVFTQVSRNLHFCKRTLQQDPNISADIIETYGQPFNKCHTKNALTTKAQS